MLSLKAIEQPTNLTSSKTQSSRTGSLLLINLIEQFPPLKADIKPLLMNILDGNAVNLSDLDNEDVAEIIAKFLKALGLVKVFYICYVIYVILYICYDVYMLFCICYVVYTRRIEMAHTLYLIR